MDVEKMRLVELDDLIDTLELKRTIKAKEEKSAKEEKQRRMKLVLLSDDGTRSLYFIRYGGAIYMRCLTPYVMVEWRRESIAGCFTLIDCVDEKDRLELVFKATRWNEEEGIGLGS